MKALTLTQPWASLVAVGAKRIETRSWSMPYRGLLAIHAAKGFPGEARRLCEARRVRDVFGWSEGPEKIQLIKELPLGCIVATCMLIDVLPTESRGCLSGVFDDHAELDTEQERAFGNYDPGRWGWVLSEIRGLATPIPMKGALGLWESGDWNEQQLAVETPVRRQTKNAPSPNVRNA